MGTDKIDGTGLFVVFASRYEPALKITLKLIVYL